MALVPVLILLGLLEGCAPQSARVEQPVYHTVVIGKRLIPCITYATAISCEWPRVEPDTAPTAAPAIPLYCLGGAFGGSCTYYPGQVAHPDALIHCSASSTTQCDPQWGTCTITCNAPESQEE